jgi:NADH:ubiquinone oxidoreductase subunit 3 (subunit A)
MGNKGIAKFLLFIFVCVLMASCAPTKKKTFRKSKRQYKKFRDYDCGCQNIDKTKIISEQDIYGKQV